MPYIYKITNNKNGKVYIGQSRIPIEQKWKNHLKDSKKLRCEKRPLYIAMKKYGEENFAISVVEYVDDGCSLDEREIFWIEYYDSFRNGYNATYGGAGTKYVDYGMVYETYLKLGENCRETAKRLSMDEGNVSKIVRALSGKDKLHNFVSSKRVNMYDVDGNYVRTFSSIREAARYVIEEQKLDITNENGYSSHICNVCKGKRKTANGYIWKYVA